MMPVAFITRQTKTEINIMFGSDKNGMMVDAEVQVQKGETFFNWTFEQLMKVDPGKFSYKVQDK